MQTATDKNQPQYRPKSKTGSSPDAQKGKDAGSSATKSKPLRGDKEEELKPDLIKIAVKKPRSRGRKNKAQREASQVSCPLPVLINNNN